jgi:feruloyl esterase
MEGYVDVNAWTNIHTAIMAQCDGLDGLVDGMITNPAICNPDFTRMNLTQAQIPVAKSIYTNWTDAQGNFLFPAFSYGAEWFPYSFVLGTAFEPGPDYFK